MLCVVSPAKRLDEKPRALPDGVDLTDPDFLAETWRLVQAARERSVQDLRDLMHLSEPLARLNHARFAAFRRSPAPGQAMAAVQCFAGDTYAGLQAETMDPDARRWAARATCASCRAFTACCGPGMRSSRTGWKWAPGWKTRAGPTFTPSGATGLPRRWAAGRRGGDGCAGELRLGRIFHRGAAPGAEAAGGHSGLPGGERGGEAKVVSFWAKKARGAMARYPAATTT
jgi:hypothetical protein